MSPTTYTYDSGAQETFDLTRGPQTPEGHAVASFKYSDGAVSDGYVNLEWLRNRLDELYPVVSSDRRAEQSRPLTPDDITDAMVQRGAQAATPAGVRYLRPHEVREVLTAALTEPAPRPENAEDIERAMEEFDGYFEAYGFAGLADRLAGKGFQFVPDPSSYCGLGPCCLEDGHSEPCTM